MKFEFVIDVLFVHYKFKKDCGLKTKQFDSRLLSVRSAVERPARSSPQSVDLTALGSQQKSTKCLLSRLQAIISLTVCAFKRSECYFLRTSKMLLVAVVICEET